MLGTIYEIIHVFFNLHAYIYNFIHDKNFAFIVRVKITYLFFAKKIKE